MQGPGGTEGEGEVVQEGKMGNYFLVSRVSLRSDRKVLEIYWSWLHNILNVINTTELYT